MKVCQQSLHYKGGQLRAGKEGDAQKLDDVRVSEGAHQLAFSHKTDGCFFYIGGRYLGVVSKEIVDSFGGADGSSYDYFLHAAVGSGTDFSAGL